MLSVIKLGVVMLSAVVLTVVMLMTAFKAIYNFIVFRFTKKQ
jgi:hypothetical protein